MTPNKGTYWVIRENEDFLLTEELFHTRQEARYYKDKYIRKQTRTKKSAMLTSFGLEDDSIKELKKNLKIMRVEEVK